MGDPLGIGPEVVVKALADPAIRDLGRFVIYGRSEFLTLAADRAGIDPFWSRVAADSERATRALTDGVTLLDFPGDESLLSAAPDSTSVGGRLSKQFVDTAIEDALAPGNAPRHIDAVVTAPISKTSWERAGYRWPGHTELFMHRTRAKRCVMTFVGPQLRVALATAHVPIIKLRDLLTIGCVFDPIDIGHESCRRLGIEEPRIAVCGLNPHAGEGGLFGDEEARVITPAIEMARGHGIDARGPFPADSIFRAAAAGRYDLVVAMYHDQGLIPVKLLEPEDSVNWSAGLPIVRTSPDHGTAFDIAGRDKASPRSMMAAIRLAARLARRGAPV